MSIKGVEKEKESEQETFTELLSELNEIESIFREKKELIEKIDTLTSKLKRLESTKIEEMKKDEHKLSYDKKFQEAIQIVEELEAKSKNLLEKTDREENIVKKFLDTEKGLERLEKDLKEKRKELNG
jgi:hypothetical protein